MRHQLTILLSVTAFVGFSGCASTSMTSFTDPAYRSASFNRILVIANISNLQSRQRIESRLVQEFRGQGIFAMEGTNLFPPTRTYSDEQKVQLLRDNHIDSYIVIDVGETGTQQVYIPQTGSSTDTKGNVSVYGNTATYQQKSTTTTYGGYTVSKPWAQFNAKLFDVSTGQTAWMASAFTGGNAYAGVNTVVNSFCGKTVEQLTADGIVKKGKQGAIVDNTKVVGPKPDDADAYYSGGLKKYDLKDDQGAIADYTKAISLNPNFADAYYNRGLARYELGDYQGAISDCTKAISLNPNFADAYYNRGCARYQLKDYQGAIADNTKAVGLKPDYAGAYYDRGLAKYQLEDYRGSFADYTKAVDLKPDFAEAYSNRGYAGAFLGDYQGAVADFTKAIGLKQSNAGAYYGRGVVWLKLAQKDKALTDFRRAIELGLSVPQEELDMCK